MHQSVKVSISVSFVMVVYYLWVVFYSVTPNCGPQIMFLLLTLYELKATFTSNILLQLLFNECIFKGISKVLFLQMFQLHDKPLLSVDL